MSSVIFGEDAMLSSSATVCNLIYILYIYICILGRPSGSLNLFPHLCYRDPSILIVFKGL